jgi:hypothetical protein
MKDVPMNPAIRTTHTTLQNVLKSLEEEPDYPETVAVSKPVSAQ